MAVKSLNCTKAQLLPYNCWSSHTLQLLWIISEHRYPDTSWLDDRLRKCILRCNGLHSVSFQVKWVHREVSVESPRPMMERIGNVSDNAQQPYDLTRFNAFDIVPSNSRPTYLGQHFIYLFVGRGKCASSNVHRNNTVFVIAKSSRCPAEAVGWSLSVAISPAAVSTLLLWGYDIIEADHMPA